MASDISFKIDFLRTMAEAMTESDLDTFMNVCKHLLDGSAKLADLQLLDQLYKKFEKKES
jgi:hypothetical protein